MDSNDIATVLEDAARGYRDEQYEWCTGSWAESRDGGQGTVVTACAEGALLHAAGFSWKQIEDYGDSDNVKYHFMDPEAIERFKVAQGALLVHLHNNRDEYLAEDFTSSSVPGWNDALENRFIDKLYAEIDGLPLDPDAVWRGARAEAKSLVIQAMEATAKDLRNGQ